MPIQSETTTATSSVIPLPIQWLLFAAAYLTCALISHYAFLGSEKLVSIALPSGLCLGVLLRTQSQRWPAFIVTAFIASLAVPLLNNQAVLNNQTGVIALALAMSSLLQAVLCAWLIRRFVSVHGRLRKPREIYGLVIVTGISAALSATITVVALESMRDISAVAWWLSWSGNVLGMLIVAPLVVGFQSRLANDNHFLLAESQRIAHIGTWYWKPPNSHIEWSDETYRIYGVDRNNFVPTVESVSSFVTQSDHAALEGWFAAWERGDNPGALEFSIVTPAGETRILTGNGEWQAHNVNAPSCFIGTVQDVTEQKRIEAALSESDARYRLIIDTTAEGIWTIDKEARTSFVNATMASMMGYNVADMLGQPLFAFMDDAGRAIASANLARRQQGISEQHDFKFVRKDGSVLLAMLSTNPIFDALGNYAGALAMVTDVSERRRIEAALSSSEAQLKLLVESAPVSLAMFDRNMCYLQVSRYSQMTYQMGEQSLQGRSHYDVVPDISPEWKAIHQRGLRGEIIRADEDKFVKSDGATYWLRWEVRPWYLANGEVGGIVIFSEDITERKQADEKVAQQLHELQRWHQAMLGRESRTLELKKEVNALLQLMGQPPRYASVEPPSTADGAHAGSP